MKLLKRNVKEKKETEDNDVKYIVFLLILFLPIILLTAAVSEIVYFLFKYPKDRKTYKNSPYYKTFGVRFNRDSLSSPGYIIYNAFSKRGENVEFVHRESDGLEYFIKDGVMYLFFDFYRMFFDEEKSVWMINDDGDWLEFSEYYKNTVAEINEPPENIPIKIIVERNRFDVDLTSLAIPEQVLIVGNYETAFTNEDSVQLKIPTTTKELCDEMSATDDLCGEFIIDNDGAIQWDLYPDVYICIGAENSEGYIGVEKRIRKGITHWHPSVYDVFDDVCKIGKPGNVLVLKTFMGIGTVLYYGEERLCPYSKDKKVLGKYYYLKAMPSAK